MKGRGARADQGIPRHVDRPDQGQAPGRSRRSSGPPASRRTNLATTSPTLSEEDREALLDAAPSSATSRPAACSARSTTRLAMVQAVKAHRRRRGGVPDRLRRADAIRCSSTCRTSMRCARPSSPRATQRLPAHRDRAAARRRPSLLRDRARARGHAPAVHAVDGTHVPRARTRSRAALGRAAARCFLGGEALPADLLSELRGAYARDDHEHVRADRDDRLVDDAPHRRARARGADRHADREHLALRHSITNGAASRRRGGRAVDRRRGRGARVLDRAGSDRGAIRARSVLQLRCELRRAGAHVPDRRSRALARRWGDGVPRPRRLPGQAARIPDRARRDRGARPHGAERRRLRRGAARGPSGRSAPGRVSSCPKPARPCRSKPYAIRCARHCRSTWCRLRSWCYAALPLTPNRKMDRKALPMPEAERVSGRHAGCDCRARERDRALAGVASGKSCSAASAWASTTTSSISAATRSWWCACTARSQQQIERPIALTDLYRFPTIRSFAAFLSAANEAASAGPAVDGKKAAARGAKRRELLQRRGAGA